MTMMILCECPVAEKVRDEAQVSGLLYNHP